MSAWCCAAALLGGCEEPPPTATIAQARNPLGTAPTARFVKIEEVTEWNGHAWGSIAEFNLIDATGAPLDRTGWRATADSEALSSEAVRAIDGDPRSIWHTFWDSDQPPRPPHALTIQLPTPVRISGFRYLGRQDKLVNGTFAQYRFYISDNGVDWGEPVASGDFTSMSSPMVEKTVIFASQTPNRPPEIEPIEAREARVGKTMTLRVHASDPDGDAVRYAAEHLPPGLEIDPQSGQVSGAPLVSGSQKVEIIASDPKGASARTSFNLSVQAPEEPRIALKAGEVRFVKLEALSEVEGRPWAAIAELDLLDAAGGPLPRTGWTASADSAGAVEAPGNAIDGNAASIWHTRWDGPVAPYPHVFVIDMNRGAVVRGFRMLPRQDGVTNGTIARFRVYQSRDGVNWGDPIAEGDFSAMPTGPRGEKTVLLDK